MLIKNFREDIQSAKNQPTVFRAFKTKCNSTNMLILHSNHECVFTTSNFRKYPNWNASSFLTFSFAFIEVLKCFRQNFIISRCNFLEPLFRFRKTRVMLTFKFGIFLTFNTTSRRLLFFFQWPQGCIQGNFSLFSSLLVATKRRLTFAILWSMKRRRREVW